MSTSVLYRALGIRGCKHQSIREAQGAISLPIQHDDCELKCLDCSGVNVRRRGSLPRSWQTPPIGKRMVTVFADVSSVMIAERRVRFPCHSLNRTDRIREIPNGW